MLIEYHLSFIQAIFENRYLCSLPKLSKNSTHVKTSGNTWMYITETESSLHAWNLDCWAEIHVFCNSSRAASVSGISGPLVWVSHAISMALYGSKTNAVERKDFDKFTKQLVFKFVQIVVQARLGKSRKSHSKPTVTSDWVGYFSLWYPWGLWTEFVLCNLIYNMLAT